MRFITLLTDFGDKDASVAIAKSILLLANPQAHVLDITHKSNNSNLIDPAYLIKSSYLEFPKGTCHVIYVGIHQSGVPSMVLCEKNGHYFLAPNNGILPLALGFEDLRLWQCYEWNPDESTFRSWQEACADVCKKIENVNPENIGFPSFKLDNIKQMSMPKPVIVKDYVECQILHITYNGNLILNMTESLFYEIKGERTFRIDMAGAGHIRSIQKHIGKANTEGAHICRFNKAGYMEIALYNSSAEKMFGMQLYNDKQIYYNSIKIFFE
jgi:S-adenosylmethionine hydrolase